MRAVTNMTIGLNAIQLPVTPDRSKAGALEVELSLAETHQWQANSPARGEESDGYQTATPMEQLDPMGESSFLACFQKLPEALQPVASTGTVPSSGSVWV